MPTEVPEERGRVTAALQTRYGSGTKPGFDTAQCLRRIACPALITFDHSTAGTRACVSISASFVHELGCEVGAVAPTDASRAFVETPVQLGGDAVELLLREARQVGALGEVLTEQTVGVLIRSAPWLLGIPHGARLEESSLWVAFMSL
jgi:hypothetical protein